MKPYILATGGVFALILAAHIARLFAEGAGLLRQPVFVLTSLLSIGFSIWAWRLLRRL
ncbi:MAG: hypothetical protein ACOZE5_06750 [Verrucomicrobiota bacterium]